MTPQKPFTYSGSKTREISFPLGGIGTGSIGLAGNGRLIDWEIYNKPNKGSTNGFSHFAIKAETSDGKLLDARVLHGDTENNFSGVFNGAAFGSFGFGVPRESMAGMPHFQAVEFTGEFPVASLAFTDDDFPARVHLTAFNPFIPLNDRDSGIPAAFFEFEVQNITEWPLTYTLAGTLNNPLPANNLNHFQQANGLSWLHFTTDSLKGIEPAYGDLCLGTDAPNVSAQQFWFRGQWFDQLEVYWQDFTHLGGLKDRIYPIEQAGSNNCGSLAVHFTLSPGQSHRVRFVITWNFPNFENYWDKGYCEKCASQGKSTAWKNYYATLFADTTASLAYCLGQWERLWRETLLFKEALFASDLPPIALEAVSANISILKTATVARLEDGTFYGFEGCHPGSGCCEGSCTHVWNYNQALPFLFPMLERSLRVSDFAYNQRPDGGMRFRMPLPVLPASEHYPFRACADGQFGGVLKTYREWKVCGDTTWLRFLWPAVRKSIEFAWAESNTDHWDRGKTGVLRGRMHHTLDMELFGPDPWLTGFYLAALKAGAEMAEALGEAGTAAEFRSMFAQGRDWVSQHLFNGEYFQQAIDLKDKSIVENENPATYWDDEHEEIKYQIGEGCEIDQVLAQWHANLYGLGQVFDPDQVRSALKFLYKYNFKMPMRKHANPHRVFTVDNEGGLVMCAFPEGKRRPEIPIPYSHEVMTGFEYAAAIQMIQNGMVEEGLRVVSAVRDRFDGEKRNPWNEIECGSNYARAMASYALLNAFSGFEFDLTKGTIGFHPIELKDGHFTCFWSLDPGWGVVEFTQHGIELHVLYGALSIDSLHLPEDLAAKVKRVSVGDNCVEFTTEPGALHFKSPIRIEPENCLKALLSGG
jgi:non-lysosomal glucosylceramidase